MRSALPIIALCFVALFACGGSDPGTSGPPGTSVEATGERIYSTHCTLCHGNDGRLGLNNAKDLATSVLDRDEMVAVVTNGRNTMMAYKNVLTKAEIQAVVDHVRTLQAAE